MECYLFELPTTGAVSFTDIFVDESGKHITHLSMATTARSSLRAVLKESKRTDGEKDYLKLVKILDDYLPYLYAIKSTSEAGEIAFKTEPVFSWRTTLSANVFQSSPRISIVGLAGELSFSLLTYAFALSNLARSTVLSIGDYEHERHLTDVDRRSKDDKLSFAVNLLRRASGVYLYIAEVVLPQCNVANPETSRRIPDLNKDVINALSNLALSDAQNLAIRKLMSKSAYDSLISPGPPLPKSHPSPALIAKLYVHVASGYSSARSLAKTHSEGDVSSDLRKYLANEAAVALALAHKWLGVDAGESGSRGGDAVAFLIWAKDELDALKEGGKKVSLGKASDNQRPKKSRILSELDSAVTFLKNYQKLNDTVHFQQVPSINELQSSIPSGRSAVTATTFEPPRSHFGPDSLAHMQYVSDAGSRSLDNDASPPNPTYARAGSYF
ncbi:hypothetical protein K439DRAFT_1545866 [Ramaria rubella]|nr:hypothetical protein K439DRAFT_1545866 [Ramaria rubella]